MKAYTPDPPPTCREEWAEKIGDLLCDLRHLADREGCDWAEIEARAALHYSHEA